MKRFTIDTLSKDKLHALFVYLERSFSHKELEPFELEEIDRTPLEDSTNTFFAVNDENKGYMYEVEVSDFSVYIHNMIYFDLKFDINEFCLVLEYQNTHSFELYLQSKSEDEDEFKKKITLFTADSRINIQENINVRRIKAHFELSADKVETID